jgi:hypothetical protein
LKVSHQRVHQLVAEAADVLWLVEPLVPLFPHQADVRPLVAPTGPATNDGDGGLAEAAEKPAAKRDVRPAAGGATAAKRSARGVPKRAAATSAGRSSNGTASTAAKARAATSKVAQPGN